jgi:hypothetical protein
MAMNSTAASTQSSKTRLTADTTGLTHTLSGPEGRLGVGFIKTDSAANDQKAGG